MVWFLWSLLCCLSGKKTTTIKRNILTRTTIALLLLSGIIAQPTLTNAQSVIDGSFEHCSSTGAVIATSSFIQNNIFTPCGSPASFSGGTGNGVAFFSDGNQAASYNLSSCTYYSPAPSNGVRNIGFATDVVLTVPLSAALTSGNCYVLTFDGLNSPGDDGSGSGTCSENVTIAAFQVGVSNSSTSFGTVVGTSVALPTANTYTALSIPFTAPAGTNNYISIRLANQANDTSILFMDNVAIAPTTCTILPVQLSSFSVAPGNGCTARLRWTMAEQEDLRYFEVEHSTDGASFQPAGRVNRTEEAGPDGFTYAWQTNLKDRENYFRLKMVDTRGGSAYSRTQTVSSSCGPIRSAVTLSPNPAQFGLSVSGIHAGDRLVVLNAQGQVFLDLQARAEKETLSIRHLPNGVYLVFITDDATGRRTCQRFVKQ